MVGQEVPNRLASFGDRPLTGAPRFVTEVEYSIELQAVQLPKSTFRHRDKGHRCYEQEKLFVCLFINQLQRCVRQNERHGNDQC